MLKCARMIKYEEDLERLQALKEHVEKHGAGTTDEDPQALEEMMQARIPGLTREDLGMLRNEGKWLHQPWTLYLTVILNSIAAAIQGWDQTGTNGANLLWPTDFGVAIDASCPRYCTRNNL